MSAGVLEIVHCFEISNAVFLPLERYVTPENNHGTNGLVTNSCGRQYFTEAH